MVKRAGRAPSGKDATSVLRPALHRQVAQGDLAFLLRSENQAGGPTHTKQHALEHKGYCLACLASLPVYPSKSYVAVHFLAAGFVRAIIELRSPTLPWDAARASVACHAGYACRGLPRGTPRAPMPDPGKCRSLWQAVDCLGVFGDVGSAVQATSGGQSLSWHLEPAAAASSRQQTDRRTQKGLINPSGIG